ncbi:TAXI family TRAP transporter solute-binding subunit [Sinomonas gamaensis]|uniref:TAXI family TRAP transporter solute-binding subunit n=1 Tax=Sinomonas gamaensis TaxID=2565624 RepID=UPI001108F2B9
MPGPRLDSLVVAGGESGGFYLEFATLLAASLERHGLVRKPSALVTGGSLDNMDRLARGEATVAIALADAATERIGAEAQAESSSAPRLVALGRVYENYVHCLVRADSGITAMGDLGGRTVGLGAPGAGTALTARRLLSTARLSVREENLGLNDGLAALRSQSIEALFWSGGVPTAAVAAAAKEIGLRLLDLSALIAPVRARYGEFYDRVLVPEGAYEGVPSTWTVGAANLLLCRADLDGDVVRGTVDLLLRRANELVPASSLGVQFLSPETLINTAGIPLHPSAEEAYREFHG